MMYLHSDDNFLFNFNCLLRIMMSSIEFHFYWMYIILEMTLYDLKWFVNLILLLIVKESVLLFDYVFKTDGIAEGY